MESLLKKRYRPTPSEGPLCKKVKFDDIRHDLSEQFPSLSSKMISEAVHNTFPETYTKKHGRKRLTYVFGLEHVCTSSSDELAPSNPGPSFQAEARTPLHDQIALNAQLQERIKELEKEVAELKEYPRSLVSQVDQLVSPSHVVYHGPNTIDNFEHFSIDTITKEYEQYAPELFKLLTEIGDSCEGDTDVKVVTAMSAIIKLRSRKALGLQLLTSFMLLSRGTSRQVISALNHAGVCMSYTTSWKYLMALTTEARYQETICSGHWMWVYDNLNIHHRVQHERQDCHSKMLNITSRLAVSLRHFPEWNIDWADTRPQKSQEALSVEDFLPCEADARELKERAVLFMMRFLVKEISSLSDLKDLVPPELPMHPVQKTETIPMCVLFKDEKYTSETVDILAQLIIDANLNGQPQIIVGDQLTCKNIRASKLWRQPEVDIKDRLTWANETPGDFHFLWEILRVIYEMFWGTPSQPGSLSNLREVIQRTRVDKAVKIFNIGDEFLIHAFKSHLLLSILTHLKIDNASDPLDHPTSLAWLKSTAEQAVEALLMPQACDDPIHHLHTCFLHIAYLYVDLRKAIRWENGPQIVRHWKWWLPRFLATGHTNYASETVHLIANLQANFPKHIAYLATHNRTVNISGKPGRGKPVDQLIEHYNLVFKQTLRSAGSNLTDKHVRDVSLSVMFLMKAAKKADEAFKVSPQSTAHTDRDASKDIERMVAYMKEKHISCELQERTGVGFSDPIEHGWKKIYTTSWIKDTLSRTSVKGENLENEGQEREDGDVDLSYELIDVI